MVTIQSEKYGGLSNLANCTPICFGHGATDNLGTFCFGKFSAQLLGNALIDVKFTSCPDLRDYSNSDGLHDVPKFVSKDFLSLYSNDG